MRDRTAKLIFETMGGMAIVDCEEGDTMALELAYQWARWITCRELDSTGADWARIQKAVEQAAWALDVDKTITGNHTAAKKSIDDAAKWTDHLINEIRSAPISAHPADTTPREPPGRRSGAREAVTAQPYPPSTTPDLTDRSEGTVLTGLTDDPNGPDRWRHFHRILIDSVEPDMFSEVLHTHEFTGKGHTHQVTISAAFKKVDQEV